MVFTVQSTDLIGTGTQLTFAAIGDALWVTPGTIIASTDGHAITSNFTGHDLRIDGSVAGFLATIFLSGGYDKVAVGKTGTVTSFGANGGNAAIYLSGGNSEVLNAGEISGVTSVGVTLIGGSNSVNNTGIILAGSAGVTLGGNNSTGDVLVNSGTIAAGSREVTVGDQFGHGVVTEGGDTYINNSGVISTAGDNGHGILFNNNQFGSSAYSTLINTGTISSARGSGVSVLSELTSISNAGAITGFDGVNLDGTDVTLNNSGDILGVNVGVRVSSATGQYIDNSGTITASVGSGISAGASPDFALLNSGIVQGNLNGVLAGDNAKVTNSGEISGTWWAVEVNENGRVINTGTMTGESGAVYASRDVEGEDGASLWIDNAGSMSSIFASAIIAGDNLRVRNSGEISSVQSSGIFGGDNSWVNNSGDISVRGTGIALGIDSRIANSGEIHGLNRGILVANNANVVNTGVISGTVNAIVSWDVIDLNLVNTGTLAASTSAIRAGFGSNMKINNSGEIIGGTAAILDEQARGVYTIFNSGTISGIDGAIFIANELAVDTFGHLIVNTGLILGTIQLSSGDDVYNGRNGIVEGDVFGGGGNDVLRGGNNADNLFAGDGDDTVLGGGGEDQLSGDDGNDTIRGGDGNDDIDGGFGDDFIRGDAGNDLLYGYFDNDDLRGGLGDDELFGGEGDDRLEGNDGADNLQGEDGNDILRGGVGDDILNGGEGDDDLQGDAGDDILLAGNGNDLLRADDGADVLNGGGGYDRASYRDAGEGLIIDMDNSSLSTGVAQGDTYVSIEVIEGTEFNDMIYGTDVRNILRGYDGDDDIFGRGGNDLLQGFEGDDSIMGGAGNDVIDGGNGTDVAMFVGDQADYTFTLLGNGNISVVDNVGNEGTDTLIDIEFVTFGGGAEIDVAGLI